MHQSLEQELKEINNKLESITTSLKDGKNFDKQTAINYISDRANAILVAIDKAENEIESQTDRYGNNPFFGENDGDYEDYEDEVPNGGDGDTDLGNGDHKVTSAQSVLCNPSERRSIYKLILKFNAKANLSYLGLKLIEYIAKNIRESGIVLPKVTAVSLDVAYLNAFNNVYLANREISILITCVPNSSFRQKLLNIRTQISNRYIIVFEIRAKELTTQYNEHSQDCKAFVGTRFISLQTQLSAAIVGYQSLLGSGISTDNQLIKTSVEKFKKVIDSIDPILKKCGIIIVT